MADREAADVLAAGARWTRLLDGREPHAPAPRSGHAMALLAPTQSVLLFGGSNGQEFFDDFHVLEPAQYAAAEPTGRQAKQKAKAKMRRSSERLSQLSQSSQRSQADDEPEPERGPPPPPPPPPLTLAWKKLVVTRVKKRHMPTHPFSVASSFGSEGSTDSPRADVAAKLAAVARATGTPSRGAAMDVDGDMHVGSGRDYHTMHYVPSMDEAQLGFRVLVVGNVVVSQDDVDDDDGGGGGRGASQQPPSFDTPHMRIDELRVKQPQLTAQWIVRPIDSMWKPHARNGHCSALLGDQLFCFGGKNAAMTAFYNDFFYFDVGLSQWREQPATGNAPSSRAFADMSASASREQLFVYGGHDSKRQFGGMFMFDVRHARWDKILSLGEKPETRINHSLTQVAPELVVLFGGRKRTSRRNDAFLYDVATMTWKRLGAQLSRRREHVDPASSSQQLASQPAGYPPVVLTQSSVASSVATVAVAAASDYPSGRTAHSAILLGSPSDRGGDDRGGGGRSGRRDGKKRIIVFGGYAGSHMWLNEVHMLEVDPVLLRPQPESQPAGEQSASSHELAVGREDMSSSNSSQSTARSSSRSSIEGALLDITNVASSQAAASTGQKETKTTASKTTYTPAAVAARRRRLAEMESKRESSPKKQRPNQDSVDQTSASQSQGFSSEPQDSGTAQAPPARESDPAMSASDAVGLQTTMVQLLQSQQRINSNLDRLAVAVREGQNLAQRDAFTTHQVFMQKQNETLEHKLEQTTKHHEAAAQKLAAAERDKQTLQEQLVAAETEVYVYKKLLEETVPKLSAHVFEAVEKGARAQNNAAHLIEAKISSLHDVLEDLRHLSGDRTETDDSPPKKGSFLDDSLSPEGPQRRTHTPAALYPQTFVRELETKLHDVVEENAALHQRVAQLESRLKKAESDAQRVHELKMAWLRFQEQEEEAKGQ